MTAERWVVAERLAVVLALLARMEAMLMAKGVAAAIEDLVQGAVVEEVTNDQVIGEARVRRKHLVVPMAVEADMVVRVVMVGQARMVAACLHNRVMVPTMGLQPVAPIPQPTVMVGHRQGATALTRVLQPMGHTAGARATGHIEKLT